LQGSDPYDRHIFVYSIADLVARWAPAAWIKSVLEIIRNAS
jgi:hypothetical protein